MIDNFVASATNFLIKHSMDGLDIDWEYPNLSEKGLFTTLIRVGVEY